METKEVLEILNQNDLSPRNVFNEDYDYDVEFNLIGKVEEVAREGGYEGQGEHVEIVIKLTALDLYFKATAYYASYNGIDDWQDWELVKPVERLVTFYE